jgi:hypothetical protein
VKIRPRVILDAHRWAQNGDHPDDRVGKIYPRGEGAVVRYFRHPFLPGEQVHKECGQTWHVHGWIDRPSDQEITLDRTAVCPGDWVVNDPGHPEWWYWRVAAADFAKDFEVV